MSAPAPQAPARPAPPRQIVLVAGPSGSGKGLMTQRSGLPLLQLDEFYRDLDDPGLPRRFGIVDWDDPASWDAGAALAALTHLAHEGRTEIPEYSISASRRTGTRELAAGDARLIVAEGIFAAELVEPLRRAGLLADALVLSRPAPLVFGLRLARDLAESRKPPLTLVRRGYALAREQGASITAWEAAGMRRVGLHEGLARLRALDQLADADRHVRTAGGTEDVLRIAAVCFVRMGASGLEVLAVRKRGTGSFMQPGGKLEPGESARECAEREIAEELGVLVEADAFEPLGEFTARAANEPATQVRASVFLAAADWLPRDVEVQAEIAEALWCPVDRPPRGLRLAPLMTEHILPALRTLTL